MDQEGAGHLIAVAIAEAAIAAYEDAVICGEGHRVVHILDGVFEITFRRVEGEQAVSLVRPVSLLSLPVGITKRLLLFALHMPLLG